MYTVYTCNYFMMSQQLMADRESESKSHYIFFSLLITQEESLIIVF